MKFLMTYEAKPNTPPPSPEKLAALGKFTEEMMKTGIVLLTGGLVRPSTGTRVRFAGGKFSVTDAALPETKELIDGFALIQVSSKEEALKMAESFMKVAGEGEGEVLQVFDPGAPGGPPV
ncbi:MAG TPA: YciI family protein [Polyangiaceae bacterium]|nr:YciI family protein [Polyangiaceae bacterium]